MAWLAWNGHGSRLDRMPELSVAPLSSVKVPSILAKAAQDIPNLRRHPRMLPTARQNYITNFTRSCLRKTG